MTQIKALHYKSVNQPSSWYSILNRVRYFLLPFFSFNTDINFELSYINHLSFLEILCLKTKIFYKCNIHIFFCTNNLSLNLLCSQNIGVWEGSLKLCEFLNCIYIICLSLLHINVRLMILRGKIWSWYMFNLIVYK